MNSKTANKARTPWGISYLKMVCIMAQFLFFPMLLHAEALAIIVHPSNSVESVTTAELAEILSGSKQQWNDGQHIFLVTSAENSESLRKLTELVFSTLPPEGKTRALEQLSTASFNAASDSLASEVVSKTPNAISFVQQSAVTDSVHTIALDGEKLGSTRYGLR